MTSTESSTPETATIDPPTMRRVIFASSLGTLFEWYDFYLYGSLATFFGSLFFPAGNETAQLLSSLATFGAGFVVRPFGAVVFGRIGDLIGRKYTFLVTILTMGFSTALIGVLPTYATIGVAAPILLLALRLAQGLALGGEYGGAATYVAEHSPDARRGYYTSYIQTTATIGFFLSLVVILGCRVGFGEATFRAWGWRIPFLISTILVLVSLYIRLKLQESPLFARLKSEGRVSKNPLKAAFASSLNVKYMLVALFGATAGQGVVWYTGQFYALTFLQATLKVDFKTSYLLIGAALLIGTPFFVVFGALSDRIGRKRIMMAGMLLAALTYVPIYMGMRHCAQPGNIQYVPLVLLLALQVIYVTMVYGPIAAFLVELFPTSIRYTSMSLPYHIGNGWFGGLLPYTVVAISTSAWARSHLAGDAIYAGLAYPIGVALISFVVAAMFIRETRGHKIDTPFHAAKKQGPSEIQNSGTRG